MILETFLLRYGYLAVFGGVIFIGETSVIAAGFLAHQGYLRLDLVIAVVTVAAFLGDQTSFLIGRWVGLNYLERKPKWQPRIMQVRRLMFRYRNLLILGFRFILVVHGFIPPVLGALGFKVRRYTALNFIGAIIWAVANAAAGYLFGMAFEAFLGNLRLYEFWVIAGLILLGIAAGLIVSLLMRKKRQAFSPEPMLQEEPVEEVV